MARVIERLHELPIDSLGVLVAESEQDGSQILRRLVEEWRTGANRFDRPGEALFGMWVGGQLVAVCGLNVDPYGGDHRIGRVRHLYVRSACRRLGVGRDLVAQVVGAARGHFDTLRLRTANPAAARLYEALGFRSTDRTVANATHVMELENAMSSPDTDKTFAGSIPTLYEAYLVPLIFQPYAADLASRVASQSPSRVLELAAGTGVVTRHLASVLPESVSIVASDLNQPMLDLASGVGTTRPVEWRQADAMELPFEGGVFDAVVCQFGAMFFPDKSKAFSEARRVLRSGGTFMFSVWDRIEENEFAHTVTMALESLFPEDPPRFLARTPHGYHDLPTIERDLRHGGFPGSAHISTVAARSQAPSPRIPAIAFCQGTPLRNEIEARGEARLGEATDIAADAIARRFGPGPVDGKMQAHIIAIER